MNMNTAFFCPFCNREVDPTDRETWHRVTGWERRAGTRPSGKQGGSDIALRKRVDEFAHHGCIRLAQDGFLVEQSSLL